MTVKTKENASLLMALVATILVVAALVACGVEWWIVVCVAVGVFALMSLFSLFMMKQYVAYKLKPIYSMVLSRDVHTTEIIDELKDKHVENISEELTAWADDNDKEIARLKQNEAFRKQYLGNVAHELKTPVAAILGYMESLISNPDIDRDKQNFFIERTYHQSQRLAALLEDISMLNRLTDSNKLYEKEDIDALVDGLKSGLARLSRIR